MRRKFTRKWFLFNEISLNGYTYDYTCKNTNPISSYCYNCYAYGHGAIESRRPRFNNNMYQDNNLAASRPIGANNVKNKWNMCYKCKKFGYIARDYRLKISQS